MSATNYSQRSYNSFAAGNASLQANSAKTKSTKSKEYESKSQPPLLTSKNAADESNEMSDAISKEDKVFSSYLFMLRMADNFAKQLNYYESIRSAEAALFLRIRKANIIEPRLKEVATQDTTSNKSQSTRKEIDERNQGKTKVKKSKQHHRHSTHTQEEETTPLEPTQKTRSHKTKKMNNKTNKNDDDITDVGKKPSFLYSALHHSVIEQVKELLLRCNTYAVEEFSHDKYESASFFLDKALFLTSERTYFDAAEESEITDESKKEHDDEGEEEKRNEKEEEELWNASNKTSSAINSRTTSIASANMEKDSDNTWKYKENDNKIKSDSKKGQLIVLFHHASDHNNNNSEEVERLRLHAATLNNFGCMERRRGRYIKSLEYFQQAIRIQIELTNDVMYTYPISINNKNNSRRQDNIKQQEVEKGEKESDVQERRKGTNDEREAENNEEVCMDKLPSLLLSLASSYCNFNLLYNDMFMYGEAVAAAQRAIHVLEQAQETMTEMEQLLLMRNKSKSRKEYSGANTNKTETKMLLRMLMMAYHNLGISLMRKSEASNTTTTNMANKFYQAGSTGSNRASLQSTMTAASAANDQEEVELSQHAFEHAQAIRNRLALIEHKNTHNDNNINTYNNTNSNTNSNETAKTTVNAKEEIHEWKKNKQSDNEFQLALENLKVSQASQQKVKNAVQTPIHVEQETQQINAKNTDLQHFTYLNNSNHNMHSVINATTTPERLAQTCSPLTLNAALQHKTNNLIQTWNQQSDETKDITEYNNNANGINNYQSDDARNVFMSTAPAKLYNECAMESNDKQAATSQQANALQSLQQSVENKEENNSQEEKHTQKHKEDEMEKGARVALPPINKCNSTNTASEQMMEKEKEEGVSHDECVNNTSNIDKNFTAPATTSTTLSLPALEERINKDKTPANDVNLVESKESDKSNKMNHLSANDHHEKDKLPHTQSSSSLLLPPVQNTHSYNKDDDNIDEKDYKNELYKRISLTKEFDARNASLSLVQNYKPSPGSSQSQRQRRSILDRINDRLKSTNSLNKNLNSYNPLANYNRLSTTSSAMPEGNLFANAARKKSSLVASVNSINNNNNNNVRNKRHSRKSLIVSKNKLYRKEQAELANQMISALEHKVQLEEKQQRRRAAIAIQKIVKGVLVRTKLSLKLKAVLLLQRNVRIFLNKVRIIHAHEALIQEKEEQRRKEKELKAVILIQRRLRSFLQHVHEKQQIEAQARRLHHAACVIQRYYRTYCIRKLIKQQEEQRAHELAKRQEQFIQRHAALRIAHAYKEYKHKCEQIAQEEQLELSKRAALVIQSH